MVDTRLLLSKPAFERLEPVFLRMGGRRQAERRGGEKQKANWPVVTPVPMGEPKGCPKNARGAGPKNRGAPVVRIYRRPILRSPAFMTGADSAFAIASRTPNSTCEIYIRARRQDADSRGPRANRQGRPDDRKSVVQGKRGSVRV